MDGRIGLGKQWRLITNATRLAGIGWVVVLALSILGAAPRLTSNDDRARGYLYTVNNDIQQNGVAVLAQNSDGSLSEIAGSPFPTGGRGLGGGDIDQQGAIRVHGNYVLAVNPGSESVAVFRKGDRGMLTPVPGSPFPSGGPAPLSLTIHGDLVYVANQAPPLANPSAAPNIVGFRMDSEGRLTPISNSTIAFPAGHGPAQVEFSPGGELIVVTSG